MRKRLRYFDLEKIERGSAPLSPTELEVKARLGYDPSAQLDLKLTLDHALRQLPTRQRQAFLLFADGWTEQAIAHELHISQQTAHRLIAKAKLRLKNILQGG